MNIPYFSKLRDLLKLVEGIEVLEPKRIDECCGFGGMFAVEEPEVSVCMGHDKVKDHMSTGAEFITGADSSCLMHMQGVIEQGTSADPNDSYHSNISRWIMSTKHSIAAARFIANRKQEAWHDETPFGWSVPKETK